MAQLCIPSTNLLESLGDIQTKPPAFSQGEAAEDSLKVTVDSLFSQAAKVLKDPKRSSHLCCNHHMAISLLVANFYKFQEAHLTPRLHHVLNLFCRELLGITPYKLIIRIYIP